MRERKIITDFIKIFVRLKPTKIKNYLSRTNPFSRSKSQLIEQKFILKKIKRYKKKKILDFGSNDCFFSKQFNKNLLYYGVDTNKELLKKKNKIFTKNFIFLKNNTLPFKKNFFDCVVVSHVIAHIYKPNFLFKEIKKVLKKEGIIIIISPNKFYKFFYFFINLFNKYWPDETISKHYSFNELIKITKKEWKVLEAFSYSINKKKITYKKLNSRFILILKKKNEK